MTRPSLSTVAYEALVRARRKFSNREEHCIRETWTAEQELVLLRLYPDMPNEVLAARLNKTVQQIYAKAHRLGLKKAQSSPSRFCRPAAGSFKSKAMQRSSRRGIRHGTAA
ncbi:hypothetical protein Q8W79_19090 [Pseudomonas aeruginosa]|nr:hypothetical protein [Pseudomonas aeruginosa]MDU0564549.1 hypothetical protein [Pseudomonas aeruginosa]MDU0784561.1 hypothetical protein [Pseudomonas aeruginosa]